MNLFPDISSIHSEEELYDDVDNPSSAKFKVSTYNSLRASDPCRPLPLESAEKSNTASPDALPCKPDPVEPLYCGTKSLYSKSPIPARSGLNRSQSVYSKIPSSNRDQDGMPRPGPLVPAQSLYPMRFNLNPITTTQNIQNQQNQRSESIYGVRGVSNSVNRGQTGGVYSVIHGNTSGMNNTSLKVGTGLGGGPCSGSNSSSSNRPESIYGAASRRHDSTDSAHGPCQVGNSGNSFGLRTLGSGGSYLSGSKTCTGTRKELHSPKGQHHMLSPIAASVISTPNTLASYHHKRSPNPFKAVSEVVHGSLPAMRQTSPQHLDKRWLTFTDLMQPMAFPACLIASNEPWTTSETTLKYVEQHIHARYLPVDMNVYRFYKNISIKL
ncbi:hypothetical protein PR048_012354 [Dryococelus australis]|uniref:Uncharacterized protein n=1 Tax=Dryococelus australis TaxID=614101 RepID=A0ABQ9HPC6_9NEOP|nr:hypothetical protein PR048_012354 [Dryococelus australis]